MFAALKPAQIHDAGLQFGTWTGAAAINDGDLEGAMVYGTHELHAGIHEAGRTAVTNQSGNAGVGHAAGTT